MYAAVRTMNVERALIHLQDFATLDANANGMLEMAEIHRLLEKQFMRTPTDEEMAAFVASTDTNRDGVISLVEYVAAVLNDRAFTVEVPSCPFAESTLHK